MLTVTIFATIVAEMLPVSNNTPLIGQLLIKSFNSIQFSQVKFCCMLQFFPSLSMLMCMMNLITANIC